MYSKKPNQLTIQVTKMFVLINQIILMDWKNILRIKLSTITLRIISYFFGQHEESHQQLFNVEKGRRTNIIDEAKLLLPIYFKMNLLAV